MSLLQELGAQLRATSEELPTGLVTVARERLNSATELLNWVRQTSVDPLGVPQLGTAVEHAEHALAALRVAQDAIAAYLAAVGLAGEGAAPPDTDYKAGLKPEEIGGQGQPPPPGPEQLGAWWQERVAHLTGEAPPPAEQGEPQGKQTDTGELLRRVAAGVRSGDRARVGRDLHEVNAATGLGLSAVSSPVLHRLAGDLLGHEPGPDDLKRLQSAATGRVRSLLPGTPPEVLDTLLARICRTPAQNGAPAHPADSAVTAGVLTGVLLARLGRDPSSLDPGAPEPLREPAPGSRPAGGGNRGTDA
ncbi:hypothetical protein [Actinoplanes sp. N902-109]|uniref:hypothetical protein n=1 Tax=Actinoplanes sp. (strain N902-109) TaxID=649831 RepID=UPI00032951AF|nr:hypothetical protein [Actinoplanes sp. N902-109]AGL18642.1 hypothetical protein L083_5132 [Actinoplanes sp. N902-109]